MEQTRDQRVLRQRFWFRLLVLLFSVASCILYGIFNSYSPTVWGVILGLSGSALVWSFVELFDFFVEIYRQFTSERSQFFIITEKHWSQLRRVFRSNTSIEDLPWEKVADIVDDLYSKTALFPFQGGIYSISKEFELAVNYITRLYWKSHGYQHSRAKKNTRDYWEPFYRDFVSIQSEVAKEPAKTFTNFFRINNRIDALREIEVSFHDYNHPEGMISFHELGDLGESVSIPSGQIQCKTLKPAYDFHRKFHENPPHGAFITVMELLFRHIKKWK